jgi:hypothetical protein
VPGKPYEEWDYLEVNAQHLVDGEGVQWAEEGRLNIVAVAVGHERAADQTHFPMGGNQLLHGIQSGAMQLVRGPQDPHWLNLQAGFLSELAAQGVQWGLAQLDPTSRKPHNAQRDFWCAHEQYLTILNQHPVDGRSKPL